MATDIVALAGPTGDLGWRIARALRTRGATLRALVRPDVSASDRTRLESIGATVIVADPTDLDEVAAALAGAGCVVSALNGLRDVIVERQGALLRAAVAAGVPRFVPSDYCADFTHTHPGDNRNFDLRRTFMAEADRAPIRVTSVFNGAFADMLGAEIPMIQPRLRRVLHWGDADQPLDWTTKDDVAAYVAAVALDPDTPRILRIAGDVTTPRMLAATMGRVTGKRYTSLRVGSIGMLGGMIALAKPFARSDAVFPPYQGMQYLRDMMSGRAKLSPMDNDRYPDLNWTRVDDILAARFGNRH